MAFNKKRVLYCGLLATVATIVGQAGWAADKVQAPAEAAASTGEGLQEIVVTAQRLSEKLQDVPLSVTAVSQEQLVKSGISNSLDIGKLAPSMKIKTFGGRPNIFIRGVGLNDFSFNSVSPVAMYRDEVAVTSPSSQSFPIFDLAQTEVLRGPQGTLFGKSTTGGAILFNSKLPGDDFEGYTRLDFGRYDLVKLEGGVTAPITDTLSVRASGYMERRNGDNINLFTGKHVGAIDTSALRFIARYHPASNFEALLIMGYSRDTGDYRAAKPFGLGPGGVNPLGYKDPAPNNTHILNYGSDAYKNLKDHYATLKLNYEAGDISLHSVTGYDKSYAVNQCDCDATPASLDTHQIGPISARELSQEFRADYNSDRVTALVGAYYNNNKQRDLTAVDLFKDLGSDLPMAVDIRVKTQTYGIFSQGSYDVTDALKLTLGARYTWDSYEGKHRADLVNNIQTPQQSVFANFLPEVSGTAKFDYFSWRAALDYKFDDNLMVYGSASRGFKSGLFGFNIVFASDARKIVEPERLTSYEIGFKGLLLDRRLRVNASAFHYDYDKLQVVSVSPTAAGTAPFTALQNAAAAKINGAELELVYAPVHDLTISSNFGVLDAKYKSFPNGGISATGGLISYSGNRLPNAPKFSSTSSITYEPVLTDNLKGLVYVEYAYVGKQYYNSAQDNLVSSKTGYGITNLRIGVSSLNDRWEVAGWIRNAFNKRYIYEATDWSFEGEIGYYYGEMRTFGISLDYNF